MIAVVTPLRQVWDANNGELIYTLRGHATEIVCLSFNPQSTIIATGSMDSTAKLWDVESGEELCTLLVTLAPVCFVALRTLWGCGT